MRRAAGSLAIVFAVAVAASLIAPPALTRGVGLLFAPWGDIADANPYRVRVEPGDAAIPRGADLWISARLEGFDAANVDLRVRSGEAAGWETVPMTLDPQDGAFRHLLLGIGEATDYLVDADGVASPSYRIEVEDVPYAARVDLTYRYPAHTGLSPRHVEGAGDIAAVAGAEVEITVRPSTAASAGEIRLGRDGGAITLESAPGEPSSGLKFRRCAAPFGCPRAAATGSPSPDATESCAPPRAISRSRCSTTCLPS